MSSIEKLPVAVVGGGLVGSLLALVLRKRGYDVTLFERRGSLQEIEEQAGRSINLVVTRRGIDALERVGLGDAVLKFTVPVAGRMMHDRDGQLAYQPYGRDDEECNYSVSRAGLNAFLIRQALERGIDVRFDMRLAEADLDRGRLRFDNTDGETTVEAETIFGADGVASAVRKAFEARDDFQLRIDMLSHGYKELYVPPAEDGGYRAERNALHIWPRGHFMMMTLPNTDGSFTGTLYMPNQGPDSFGQYTDAEGVRELFEREFADSIPLMPDYVEDYLQNPTGELGTVRCYPWHHEDRVLLLGDASHGIVPFFGQGMNSGFEDCSVLGDLLDQHGRGEWGPVFAEMSRRRKPNCDAIADLALENFVEMSDKVGDDAFLLRKAVEHRIEVAMPELYRSRYSMVMYSTIPFRDAFDAGVVQREILDELCAGIDNAEQVDLDRARQLIDSRLTPFLAQRNIALDY